MRFHWPMYRFQILRDGKPLWSAEDIGAGNLAKRVVRCALNAIIDKWLT